MELFQHQVKIENEIFEAMKIKRSVLVQSPTGSGKTVIMCSSISRYIKENPDKIVVVSVHREELIDQTSKTLARFGILNERITRKTKKSDLSLFSNVYVGMTQTIHARQITLDAGLLVIDEAHEQVHLKTFGLFENAFKLAFSATPVLNLHTIYYKCQYCESVYDFQDVCCYNDQVEKWKKPVTLSEQYEDVIVGPTIRWLIDNNFLVEEAVTSFNYYSELKDIDDENEIAIESVKHDDQVLKEYQDKCEGKKTMIFTASTKQNVSLVRVFEAAGYNIRSYDSVNNKSSERSACVKWFRETEGAILVSTGTFTTGFDEPEVEAIIINRPTKSLSLWHQIVGRGGRTSTKILKDFFIVIDLGGNTDRFGKWSDFVDWRDIFFNGRQKPKKKKEELIQCDKCAYNWIGVTGDSCPDCGHTNQNQNPTTRNREERELQQMKELTKFETEIPLPNPAKISDFVQRTSNQKKDYFKIIIERYIELWKLNRVSKTIYEQRIEKDTLVPRIEQYIDKMYRFHFKATEGQPRTKSYLIDKIQQRLSEIYK